MRVLRTISLVGLTIVASLGLSQSVFADKFEGAVQHPDVQRVELLIDNYAFVLPRPIALRLGTPTALILRNQDIVRHGLTAPMFAQLSLRVEGEGIATFGKGIEGVHIDPGKTVVLYFTPERGGSIHSSAICILR